MRLTVAHQGCELKIGTSQCGQPFGIAGLLLSILEARVGIEPALTDLQSAALPLCHRALLLPPIRRNGDGAYPAKAADYTQPRAKAKSKQTVEPEYFYTRSR